MELKEYLDGIINESNRHKFESLLYWVKDRFPNLELLIKWNQPMFLDHGTFIVSFTAAKNHFSIAPETVVLNEFINQIKELNYAYSKKIFRIMFNDEINYDLLEKMILRSIELKENYDKFWL
jgi:uncharacterized protein YdhG (YjbR/CyaY superfamily)